MPNTQPLVSVIIPAYNGAKRIAKTLEAIINQDYENLEIILVNDASTDNTLNIAESLLSEGTRKFLIINHEKNLGVSTARNRGLKAAEGKYIWFCDSDDLVEKNFVSTLVNLAEKYNADISFCEYVKKFENGKPDELNHIKIKSIGVIDNEKAMYLRILNKIAPHLCATLFRKNLLIENKINFYDGCVAFEDIEFQLKAFCHAEKISFTPECLYIYLQNSEMGSIKNNDTQEKRMRRYIDSSEAHYRAAEYLSRYGQSEKIKFLADNLLVPEAVIRKFTIYAKMNDRTNFNLLCKDKEVREILKSSRRVFFMKPEIFLKAFMILCMPSLYFSMRREK